MLDGYFYDLTFYAPSVDSVAVVSDWHKPAAQLRDNWHKELADAATFAPRVAAEVLVAPAELSTRICRSAVTWLIGSRAATTAYPFLSSVAVVYGANDLVLWRADLAASEVATALGCAGRPSTG
jgi:hypothetical protein